MRVPRLLVLAGRECFGDGGPRAGHAIRGADGGPLRVSNRSAVGDADPVPQLRSVEHAVCAADTTPSALPTTYSYSFGEEDGGISNTTSARMLQQIWGDERLSEGLFLLQQGLSPTADTSVVADESTLERRRRGLLSSPAPTPPLSLDECDTDLCGATGGGWTLVRRVAPGSTWHPR